VVFGQGGAPITRRTRRGAASARRWSMTDHHRGVSTVRGSENGLDQRAPSAGNRTRVSAMPSGCGVTTTPLGRGVGMAVVTVAAGFRRDHRAAQRRGETAPRYISRRRRTVLESRWPRSRPARLGEFLGVTGKGHTPQTPHLPPPPWPPSSRLRGWQSIKQGGGRREAAGVAGRAATPPDCSW